MVEPACDFPSFVLVLASNALDTALELADRDTEMRILANTLQPSYDRAVRLWFAEFGNDTGIQQIMNHLNPAPLRRLSVPLLKPAILD